MAVFGLTTLCLLVRPILGGPQRHPRRSDRLAGRTRHRQCAGCSNCRRPISQASAADRRTKRCQLVPLAAQRFDLPYWESSAADPPTISPLRGTARLSSVTGRAASRLKRRSRSLAVIGRIVNASDKAATSPDLLRSAAPCHAAAQECRANQTNCSTRGLLIALSRSKRGSWP
jgi:hypothetical protein